MEVVPKYVVLQLTDGGSTLSLKRVTLCNYMHLHFGAATDGDIWEVTPTKEKDVVRLSLHAVSKAIWNNSAASNWVLADADFKIAEAGRNSLFMVSKNSDNTVSLKCMANNNFLNMAKEDTWAPNCIAAKEGSVTALCKFIVKDAVKQHSVSNLVYQTQGIRSPYNSEKSVVLAEGLAPNKSNSQAKVRVAMTYTNTLTASWHNANTLSVPMVIDVARTVPTANGDGLEMHPWKGGNVQWDKSYEESNKVGITYAAQVPACKTLKVQLIGTLAVFEVPFTYTQNGTLINGATASEAKSDGVFRGSNYYNYYYNISIA